MTDEVKIVESNQGEHIAVSGDINSILASKDDTGGNYSLIEAKVFPNGGPPPHIQTREHEGFYLIEGELTFTVDGQEILVKPGAFVNVPPRVIHSFKNNTDTIAKMIIVLSPGGLENLFVEVGTKVSDTSVPPPPMSEDNGKKFVSLLSKYGVEIKH